MALTKVTYSMIEGASFSILDFGAVGDGIANDTAAIQAAVDAAEANGGGTVYIPTGTYKITATIEVPFGVSIYGEGASVSVINCINCDGLTFDSPTYDSGNMFYRDFTIDGTGSTGNYVGVVSLLPSGGTFGTDSRDGLHFHRVDVHDFNEAFVFAATWETHLTECRIYRCNTGVSLLNYTLEIRINNCNFICEGGFASGTAVKRGVDIVGPTSEAIYIVGNYIYGFDDCVKSDLSIALVIRDNDFLGLDTGVTLGGAARTGCVISSNYFDMSIANSVGIKGLVQAVENENLYVVENNAFVGNGLSVNTTGILIGDSSNTYSWYWRITNNYFRGLTDTDIKAFNTRNTIIQNNRCDSIAPTNSIYISGNAAPYFANYILNNYCRKAIYADANDLTSGRVILNQDVISGVQAYGNGFFNDIIAEGRTYTHIGGQYVLPGANFDDTYAVPEYAMLIMSVFLETATNTHTSGLYIVVRTGTLVTISPAVNLTSLAITPNVDYTLNFENVGASGGNAIISMLRVR